MKLCHGDVKLPAVKYFAKMTKRQNRPKEFGLMAINILIL